MIYAPQPAERRRRAGVVSTLIGLAIAFAWVLVPLGSTHQLTTLLVSGLVGAVLTILYLWHRNLFSCILTHTAVDGIFFIVIPLVVHPR